MKEDVNECYQWMDMHTSLPISFNITEAKLHERGQTFTWYLFVTKINLQVFQFVYKLSKVTEKLHLNCVYSAWVVPDNYFDQYFPHNI